MASSETIDPAGADESAIVAAVTAVGRQGVVTEHSTSQPPATAGQRKASPLALALLNYAARGTIEEQLFLLRASRQALAVAPDETRKAALEALRQCSQDLELDRAPSRTEFRRWLADEPLEQEWPTDHVVARSFGGRWSAVRAEMDGEPTVNLRALSVGTLGAPIDDDDLLVAIRRWQVECPDPRFRFHNFRRWAEAQLAVGSGLVSHLAERTCTSPVPKLAFSPNTYIDRFGSWLAGLAAAGVLDDISFESFRLLLRSHKSWPREELVQSLRDADQWARTARGRPLTRALLEEHRQLLLQQLWSERRFEPMPSPSTIIARLGGSLITAMREAGIVDEKEASRRAARRGTRVSREVLVAHVKLCAAQNGIRDPSLLPEVIYTRWRAGLVSAVGQPIPAAITIFRRMGTSSWREGVARAAAEPSDPQLLAELRARYSETRNPTARHE